MGGGGSGRSGTGSRAELESLERTAREELKRPQPVKPRQRVFLSFQNEDLQLVNAFRGQSRSEQSGLDFIDFSLQVPFNSQDADYIRRGIRTRIQACSVTIVLVGETTYQSEWVDWEIRESLRLGKGVVAVRLGKEPSSRLPSAVVENDIPVLPWDNRVIMERLSRAAAVR